LLAAELAQPRGVSASSIAGERSGETGLTEKPKHCGRSCGEFAAAATAAINTPGRSSRNS
jgi:hypothetical protein